MKPALLLKVKQNQRLSPKLQQAIRLLHLSAAELDLEIQQALEENPILELNDEYEESQEYSASSNNLEAAQNLYATTTLHDYLHWQLMLAPFSARDKIIATTLIDSINDDGYLCVDLTEMHNVLQQQYNTLIPSFDLEEITMVLHRIQQFDPIGVAARTLNECMLLQIKALQLPAETYAACKTIINEHLDLVAHKSYANLQKLLNLDAETLEICLQKILSINPKPGLLFSAHKPEYIIPDLLIKNIDDKWQINLQYHITHNLKINASYAQLMQQSNSSQASLALRQQYNEARWFLDSLKQRNITLLNVANCIMQQQTDFLMHGETHIRPLILQDVALALGISESTISRVTTRKYINTPRGIYELKFFFSQGLQANNGSLCSATAIKAILKDLIQAEDPKEPLSDQALTNIMSKQGICIARRTVTKYREALGILASNQRGI